MVSYKYNNTIFLNLFQVFLQRSDILEVLGIIAEFNPLHNGHKYLINEAKKHGTVICVISGNFVERGDTAIFEKRLRTEAALECGADLVIELPVCYSMSTAANFALGAVSMLSAIGCDSIMFGSECGDIDKLIKTSNILRSNEFSKKLPAFLDSGITFAAARQKAAEECGAEKGILEGANNNLAIEYITAARNINSNIGFKTISRIGAMHDSASTDGRFASASAIRELVKRKGITTCEKYIPDEALKIFKNAQFSDISLIQKSILAMLRAKEKEDFKNLPDISEGVENKLFSAIKTAKSLDELYETVKVKRYTLARIRRLVLSAFLGIDNRLFLKAPPYMRVLGFNKTGEEHLRQNKDKSPIPVVMRINEVDALGKDAIYMRDLESRATNLYALSFKQPLECGLEYTRKLIKHNF